MKKDFYKNERGFTLIETLVAIAIFASAITGLIAITAGGVSNTNYVKNKFTAGYLAMEGAEIIRNIRDTTMLDSVATWADVLARLDNCMSPDACYVDTFNPGIPAPCPSGDCPYLTYQDSTGTFDYQGYNGLDSFVSVFKRKITVEPIAPAENTATISEIKVTSLVEWQQGSRTHKVTYSYILNNWVNP